MIRHPLPGLNSGSLRYNPRFDAASKRTKQINQHREPQIMEAERINALSALLNDLTDREAELRRYL
jgi:hypothetical protein